MKVTEAGRGGKREASDIAVERLEIAVERTAARREECVLDPARDFTRDRKLTLAGTLRLLCTWGVHSLQTELNDMYGWDGTAPSVAALGQRRRRLSDRAMPLLNEQLLRQWEVVPYRGRWRLLAADGTAFGLPGPGDESTRVSGPAGAKRAVRTEMRPTLAYDPIRGTFEDMVAQGARRQNEPAALCQIVDRMWPGRAPDGGPLRALWLADRNYSSYNVMCHMAEAGADFCMRATDERVARALFRQKRLPEGTGELDRDVSVILTRTEGRRMRTRPEQGERYRSVTGPVPLDVLPKGRYGEYDLSFRVVRVRLPSAGRGREGDGWLNLVTSLPRDEFPPSELADLYKVRWKEELAIRDLKHAEGRWFVRTRDVRLAVMEVWGRLVQHNASVLGAAGVAVPAPGPRRERASDRATALRGMREKLRGRKVRLERACSRCSHSVRRGRSAPRNKRTQPQPRLCYNG